MTAPKIPFTVLALAPLGPVPDSSYRPRIIPVDRENLDQAFAELRSTLFVPVPRNLCPEGSLTLNLESVKDFHPDRLIEKTEFLKNLLEARDYIQKARKDGTSDADIRSRLRSWPNLPLELPEDSSSGPGPAAKNKVDDILSMVAASGSTAGTSSRPGDWAAQLEDALVQLVSRVFENPEFRRYESAWRGVEVLLKQGKLNHNVQLKLAAVSETSLEEAVEKLRGQLIEDPPSLILVDLPLDSSPRALELLELLAALGEAVLAPVAVWINEGFFHLAGWRNLSSLPYLGHLLDEAPYAKWRRLRGLPSANWLAVAMNRFLARYPYGRNNQTRKLGFEETAYLWIGPVWALGSLICRRVMESGWPTRFIEYQSMRLADLAVTSGDDGPVLAVEAELSEDRMVQFEEVGMIPLVGQKARDVAFIPRAATVAGGSLAYQLALSRMVQVLLWCKDNLEPGLGPAQTEVNLKAAIAEFWTDTAEEVPEDLEVSVTEAGEGEPFLVSLGLTPPRKVLPSQQRIEFSFNW